MSEFRDGMAEILDVEASDLVDSFELGELGASLAVVSAVALIDEVHDVSVNPEELVDCKTFGDIVALVNAAVA